MSKEKITYIYDQHRNRIGFLNWETNYYSLKDIIVPEGLFHKEGDWLVLTKDGGSFNGKINLTNGDWINSDSNFEKKLYIAAKGYEDIDFSTEGIIGTPEDTFDEFPDEDKQEQREREDTYDDFFNMDEDGQYSEIVDDEPEKDIDETFRDYTKDILKVFFNACERVDGVKQEDLKKANTLGYVCRKLKSATSPPSVYDHYLDMNASPIDDINYLCGAILSTPFGKRKKGLDNFDNLSEHEKRQSIPVGINSYLKCLLNVLQYYYIQINPDQDRINEVINIPEEFIDEICLSRTYEELMESIEVLLNSYIDKKGKVMSKSSIEIDI